MSCREMAWGLHRFFLAEITMSPDKDRDRKPDQPPDRDESDEAPETPPTEPPPVPVKEPPEGRDDRGPYVVRTARDLD
jgi:hypothetical protein